MTQMLEQPAPAAAPDATSPAARPPRVTGVCSVIVPAYNAAKSLSRCLDSILAQTYRPLEVIVIDDGSTDDTAAVAASYGDRVRLVRQANRGETATRNRGFELSTGEFVTFLDHDDHWDPAFVEACVAFLKDHPHVSAAFVGNDCRTALRPHETHVRPGFLAPGAAPSELAAAPFVVESFFEFWLDHEALHPGCAVIRGDLIDRAGGQRTDLILSGDMEYWAYLATFGQWAFIPRVLLHVDGAQIPRGQLWKKFYDRFRRCPSIESWQQRIVPRLAEADRAGFAQLRGRVATAYVFAMVFSGRDADARDTARAYANDLEGKFGKLWRLGLALGPIGWWSLCRVVRLRTRVQYLLADRKL